MSEIWKSIPNFKYYEASSFGKIRSIDREVIVKRGSKEFKRKRVGIVLTPYRSASGTGYYMVDLRKNHTTYKKLVHRLVAETFIGKIPAGLEVNHIDFNKLNNNIANLEIVTKSENIIHNIKVGNHNKVKLSPEQVQAIRRMYEMRTPQKIIANLMGVERHTIANITKRKTWKTL